MKYFSVRKSTRLKGYDYNQNGAYFLTVCVKDRHNMLGEIVGHGMPFVKLSEYGVIVEQELSETPLHYQGVKIDTHIVMPNHIHMILSVEMHGVPRASRPTTALVPTIIAALKKKTNKAIGFDIWQKSYHDHILRNEEDYQIHARYIAENPARWMEDEYTSFVKL